MLHGDHVFVAVHGLMASTVSSTTASSPTILYDVQRARLMARASHTMSTSMLPLP